VVFTSSDQRGCLFVEDGREQLKIRRPDSPRDSPSDLDRIATALYLPTPYPNQAHPLSLVDAGTFATLLPSALLDPSSARRHRRVRPSRTRNAYGRRKGLDETVAAGPRQMLPAG
jgi:hypothetical protein